MAQMSGLIWLCSAGETFDSIALAVYGDEKHAAELMDANPSLVRTTTFCGGERLNLPTVERATDGRGNALTDAPWKE